MDATLHQVSAPSGDGKALRALVLVTVVLGLILPIVAGLYQTLRAGLGILPAIGADHFTFAPWNDLMNMPGLTTSLRLSIVTGSGATILSLLIATGLCALLHSRLSSASNARLLAPFLAAPHAALAIGMAFILAPSGWIARFIAPFFDWSRPPDIASVNDPWGVALMIGLMAAEVPFFLLVILSALTQLRVREHLAAGRALGYGRGIVWIKVIMPQVWPLIRLPTHVVLAYALSVVDMAIILGPSNPPTLAVALTRWFSDPDTKMILPASAGAILQGLLVLAGFALLWLCEALGKRLGRIWLRRGGRGLSAQPGLWLASGAGLLLMVLATLAMLSLLFWSLAWRWSYPAPLPTAWSLRGWSTPAGGWGAALSNTLTLAVATSFLSLLLAIAWLEGEDRARRNRARWANAMIYAPLLVPQIGFLYGLNVLFLRLGLSGSLLAVIWAQALFVFPYVMITLSNPWRALDPRMARAAAALGAGPWRRLLTIKLPMLLSPLLIASAIGIAVSVAQYLPTLFMGAGRINTLTTEAVTLASGSDRRVTGLYAILQAVLPFGGYLAAFMIPAFIYRNRRAFRGS